MFCKNMFKNKKPTSSSKIIKIQLIMKKQKNPDIRLPDKICQNG
jgi:hypothetical protein